MAVPGSVVVAGGNRSEDYDRLMRLGLDGRVVAKLDDIFASGKLAAGELDDRALDALKGFPVDGALAVLDQFVEASLEHVSNKSAFICGIMKSYRHKVRALGLGSVAPGGVQDGAFDLKPVGKGPDALKLAAILKRTGYSLDVTTGQRRYGGPPPDWRGDAPGRGCEVFCGRISRNVYEDELIPLFEQCGTIWDLRLMMDPLTGLNRGYAFVTFTTAQAASEAVNRLNSVELKGRQLLVNVSAPNARLFVGNIPKCKSKEEIGDQVKRVADGLVEVIVYSSPDEGRNNRGFCFLEFESHKSASVAKRRLTTSRGAIFDCDIIVDWADPLEEPADQVMSTVKVLYVRNLTHDVTEETLKAAFQAHGPVHRVKKIKDYAFVHFEERGDALDALQRLDGHALNGVDAIQVSLAKPPTDPRKKEEMLRARERRLIQQRNPIQRNDDGLLPPPTGPTPAHGAPSASHPEDDCAIYRRPPYVQPCYDAFYPYACFYDCSQQLSGLHHLTSGDQCDGNGISVASCSDTAQGFAAVAGEANGQPASSRRGRHWARGGDRSSKGRASKAGDQMTS